MKRFYLSFLIISLMLPASGCNIIAYMATMVLNTNTPYHYKLPSQSTAVLVDDPQSLLTSPLLPGRIIERVGFQLAEHHVVDKKLFISSIKVRNIASQLGDQYYQTPIDRIGKQLDAKQIIYIQIISSNLGTDPGVVEPSIVAAVKVIDVTTQQRVFPPSSSIIGIEDTIETQHGFPVTVRMRRHIQTELTPGDKAIIMQTLADTLANHVAQLFYKHIAYD